MDSDPDGTEKPPSPIDLTSTIGTWIAAGLAFIALVGIVGPWLTLRAAQSDENRAKNAIDDRNGRYVTRGWTVLPGAKLFRQIKVPDFAPMYRTNDSRVGRILKEGVSASNILGLDIPDYRALNAGWAKFAAVCEGYRVVGEGEQGRFGNVQGEDLERLSKIVVPKGGAVEVVNSLAVLVVSRYWVLAMGLLGRYRTPEVVSRPPPQGGQDLVQTVTQLEDQISLGEGRSIRIRYGDGDSHSLSDISVSAVNRTVESVQQTQHAANQPIELKKYRAIRGRHGTWELSGTRRPEIQGFTGSFLSLGRQKGVWNYQSLVAFQTRSRTEIREMLGMKQRISRKEEASSLRTLLCLAHGLLPSCLNENWNVISVLDPVSEGFYSKSREFLTENGRRVRSNHHQRHVLRVASTVPSVLATSAASFGISNLKVNEWAPFSPPPAPADNDGNPDRNNNQYPPPHGNNNNDGNHPLNNEGGENPSWYIVPGSGKQLRLDDVSNLLLSFFSLDWDEWGYLTRKSNCDNWANILEPAASFLEEFEGSLILTLLDRLHRTRTMQQPPDLGSPFAHIFEWNLGNRDYFPPKTRDLVGFEKALEQLIPENRRWLKLPIASLFITNDILRASAFTLLSPLQYVIETLGEEGDPAGQDEGDELHSPTEDLTGNAQAAQNHAVPQGPANAQDPNEPQLTTAPAAPPEAPQDTAENAVERWRQDIVEEQQQPHPRSWSSIENPRWDKTTGMGFCDQFRASVADKTVTLKWRTIHPQGPRRRLVEEVEAEVKVPNIGNRENEEIEGDDIVVIAAWAATRCLLWLSSDDSAPLLKFVGNLDRHIWVV